MMVEPAQSVGSGALGPAAAAAGRAALRIGLTAGAPVVLALVLSGAVLWLMGSDPLDYYGYVVRRAFLTESGFQATLTRMAPLLLLAAGLILAFRAGLWNLGLDGQFMLGAVAAAAVAPALAGAWPVPAVLLAAALAAVAAAALWSLLPALLKAYHGVNEIITTLMMSFLGLSVANALVKMVFLDPGTTVPQTRTLAVADRLPPLPGTTVSSGLVIGLIAVVAVHLVMTRTSFGLRLRIVGANPRAAVHVGLHVPLLTLAVFALSAGLVGLAGAVEILGVHGNVRADWNPAFGLAVIPLVFLARLNGLASIVYVLFFSALQIGAESAARRLGVPHYFSLVLVANLLIVLALVEHLAQRWRLDARS
ncbi:putative B6 ABC transporter permease subunit 2 [Azospirillum sp. ST 5-10]|uniref:putative B6 ABC transporter permease subunit 2 n=1 Tax=unclassified Azospirillum TaxID=2630922 RepID=UPI003F4A7387